METGADELLREVLPTGRLAFGTDGSMIERTSQLVVVIGTPVDEFLGAVDDDLREGGRPDRAAPPRRAPSSRCAARSTRARPATSPSTWPSAAAASTSRSARSGSPRATPSRSSTRCRRSSAPTTTSPPSARPRCSARSPRKTIRTTTKEAELAKLFTNTWRYMKFAVANQFFMIADQAGVDYTNVLRAIREDYPRAADLPGPGFAAGPCLFKDTMQLAAFTADHFPLGQAAMQVNEGLPAYIVSALERRYGGLHGQDRRHPRAWPSRPSPTTRGRRSATSCASSCRGPARASLCTDPYVEDDRLVTARLRPRGERHPDPRRAAQAVPRPRGRRQGRRRRLGRPRRGDPALVRILVTGAAGFINGYLVPELLEAGHEVIGLDDFSKYGRLAKSYDDHPRYRFVEGDAKDAGAAARARRRLRPGRRGRGDDRRHQLLPRVRLRPAGRERADPRVDVRRGDRRPSRRPPRADHRRQQLDGLRVRDGLPDAGGRAADLAAAGLDLRLPEARLGVLRQGRLGAVPAAVHDRPAVQLRRASASAGPSATRTS